MDIESKQFLFEDSDEYKDEFGRTPHMLTDDSEEKYKVFVWDQKEALYVSRKACYLSYRLRLPLEFAEKDDKNHPVFKELPEFDFREIKVIKAENMKRIIEYLEAHATKPLSTHSRLEKISDPLQSPWLCEYKDEKGEQIISDFDLEFINKYDDIIFSDDVVYGEIFRLNTEDLKDAYSKSMIDSKYENTFNEKKQKYDQNKKNIIACFEKLSDIIKAMEFLDGANHPLVKLVLLKFSSIDNLATKHEIKQLFLEKFPFEYTDELENSEEYSKMIKEFQEREEDEFAKYLTSYTSTD